MIQIDADFTERNQLGVSVQKYQIGVPAVSMDGWAELMLMVAFATGQIEKWGKDSLGVAQGEPEVRS